MDGSDVDELAAKTQTLVALHGEEKTDPSTIGAKPRWRRG